MDQPQPGPFFCSVCEIQLESAQAWRHHAKDESHVYKLRCRIAEPGTAVTQLPPISKGGRIVDVVAGETEQASGVSLDEDSNGDSESDSFDPSNGLDLTCCLFCDVDSESSDANRKHMSKEHSFMVPHRDSLAVDVETLLWYLHLVIYKYHECILCGKQRKTLEAVQQHMQWKGHCRFNVKGEYADFYEASLSEPPTEDFEHLDEASLRLPSGKLLTHRSHLQQAAHTARALRRSQEPSLSQPLLEDSPAGPTGPAQESQSNPSPQAVLELDASAQASGVSSTELERADRRSNNLDVQLSRLSHNDQRGLMHLSAPEQRSVLATRKKQLDQAQREERRMRIKVERMGNTALMKHFKPDVPGRLNG